MPIDFIDLTADEDEHDLPFTTVQRSLQDSTSEERTHAELSDIWQARKKPVTSLLASGHHQERVARPETQKGDSNASFPNRSRRLIQADGLRLPANEGIGLNSAGTARNVLSNRPSKLPSSLQPLYEMRTQRLNYEFRPYNMPIPEQSRLLANGQSGSKTSQPIEVYESSETKSLPRNSLVPMLAPSKKRTIEGRYVNKSKPLVSAFRAVSRTDDSSTTIVASRSAGDASLRRTDLFSGTSTADIVPANKLEANSIRRSITSSQPLTILLNPHDNLRVATAGPVARSPTTIHAGDTDLTRSLMAEMAKTLPSGSFFTPEEDTLIVHLKEDTGLRWPELYTYFPHRSSWSVLQKRYSKFLKSRSSLPEDLEEFFGDSFTADAITSTEYPTRKLRPNNNMVSNAEKYVPIPRRFGSDDEEEVFDSPQGQVATDLTVKKSTVIKHLTTSMRLKDTETLSELLDPRLQTKDSEIDIINGRISEETGYSSKLAFVRNSPLVYYSDRCRVADEADRDAAALSSLTTSIFRPPALATTPFSKGIFNQRAIRRKRSSLDMHRPYLSVQERRFLADSISSDLWDNGESIRWDGKIVHVDFADEEMENLTRSIHSIRGIHSNGKRSPITILMANLMKDVLPSDIYQISWHAQTNCNSLYRTRDSIESFLNDASRGTFNHAPSFQRLGLRQPVGDTGKTINSCLRLRELGSRLKAPIDCPSATLKLSAFDTMGPLLSYTGTSGDVTTVTWAPNGELFAAGSAALTDDHSMQYNEPNNLLLGDLTRKTLRELPDHAVQRPRPSVGPNATEQMYLSQDPLLFTSITAVQFSPDSQVMLSAGYDRFVRVWQVGNGLENARCTFSCKHQAPVDLIAVNLHGLFATGSQRPSGDSVIVMRYDLDVDGKDYPKASFSSQRAIELPESMIVPSCLRWGNALDQQYKYLLCGFTSNAKDHRSGEVCVFDVEAEEPVATFSTRNVFDAAWSPNVFGRYAVGCIAGPNVNRGTKSVLRLYDSRCTPVSGIAINKSYTMELECPALDINDVVFNPYDDNMVSVGCTDCTTYLWDIRNPSEVMHRLRHSRAIMELDESLPREEVDTGIRFLSWGHSHRRLYTGSSDGVVAAWDPCLSPDNTALRNVVKLNSGVMSGEFSPDFSNLLLGEVNGSISMLAVGRDDVSIEDAEKFLFQDGNAQKREIRRKLKSLDPKAQSMSPPSAVGVLDDSGVNLARKLVASKQIELQRLGDLPIRQAVQGPRYSGPFDSSEDAPGLRLAATNFQTSFRPSLEPCKLQKCRLKPKLTEEEQGDSGAWKARIAENVRYRIPSSRVPKSGKLESQIAGLTCLRCKRKKPMKPRISQNGVTEAVRCPRCKITWRVDILGYAALTVAGLKPGGLEPGEHLDDSDYEPGNDNISFVRDAIPAHYHSLWHDAPASPL